MLSKVTDRKKLSPLFESYGGARVAHGRLCFVFTTAAGAEELLTVKQMRRLEGKRLSLHQQDALLLRRAHKDYELHPFKKDELDHFEYWSRVGKKAFAHFVSVPGEEVVLSARQVGIYMEHGAAASPPRDQGDLEIIKIAMDAYPSNPEGFRMRTKARPKPDTLKPHLAA